LITRCDIILAPCEPGHP